MGELLHEHISTAHGEKVEIISDPSRLILPKMPEFGREADVPELVLGFFRNFWEANGFSTGDTNHFDVLAINQPNNAGALLLANRYVGTPTSPESGHTKQKSSNGWASLGTETYSITQVSVPSEDEPLARARVTASADLLVTKTHTAPPINDHVRSSSGGPPLPEWAQPRFKDRDTFVHWQGQRLDRYRYWGQWLYRDAWEKRLSRSLRPIAAE